LDDAYVMLIRQANLDAMGSRAVATIEARAATIQWGVDNCQLFRKMPSIPLRGPMPIGDSVGMGLAVELLVHLLTAVPHIKGEKLVQFDTMRKPRSTLLSAWESSSIGIKEGSMFSLSMAKIMITSCPTQQKWFNLMMSGAESRMGLTSQRQQPLGVRVIVRWLNLIKEEDKDQEPAVAREYYKVGATIATALRGSLRGSEVFILELTVLQRHINIGCGGALPPDPMKAGINLSLAPPIIIFLLGEFKSELGVKYHLMSLASTTSSGIELRWGLEKLIQVREEEGCISGPTFGQKDGLVALMREYNEI
jgi:hypothetical protein